MRFSIFPCVREGEIVIDLTVEKVIEVIMFSHSVLRLQNTQRETGTGAQSKDLFSSLLF